MDEQHAPEPSVLINLLNMYPNEMLLVLFDRFGFDVAHWFAEGAERVGIPFVARYMPMFTQLNHAKSGALPEDLKKCLERSQVLVTAISDYEECTRFRSLLLQAAQNATCKILHLPGVDWQMFVESLQGLDLTMLEKEAQYIKSMLESAQKIKIFTRDENQDLHTLSLDILGRQVHLDIGMPLPGEIAQLPAGEVYLAPVEYTAVGSVVINGSVPERVLRNGNMVVLNFDQGVVNLKKCKFSNSVTCIGFISELMEYGSQDQNNLALGELGIGINRGVTRLTGSPIHDEKAAGTVHIALGCNVPFDGSIECDNHIDLIFFPERVLVDGTVLPLHWGLRMSEMEGRHGTQIVKF